MTGDDGMHMGVREDVKVGAFTVRHWLCWCGRRWMSPGADGASTPGEMLWCPARPVGAENSIPPGVAVVSPEPDGGIFRIRAATRANDIYLAESARLGRALITASALQRLAREFPAEFVNLYLD